MAKTPKPSAHRYDWRPDLPDQRDLLFSERAAPRMRLPDQVDLREHCPPVLNQGKIGSCTGNALASAIEFLELAELRQRGKEPKPEVFTAGKFAHASRLFIYYNERALEGKTGMDGGASLRDGVKSLVKWGVCRESVWKYGAAQVLRKPSAKAYQEAKDHRISTYLRLERLEEMKQCLADSFPFAFGFTVYESFESPEVAKNGEMPMPEPDERALGGHAVLAVGYDDSSERLIVKNSWGTSWGQEGYFTMPYAYVTSKALARDFWTLHK